MVADRSRPGQEYYAEFCHFLETVAVGQFAHRTEGIHFELQDGPRHEVHAQVGEESRGEEEDGVAHYSYLADAEGEVEDSHSHGRGEQGKDGAPHGAVLDGAEGSLEPAFLGLSSLLLLVILGEDGLGEFLFLGEGWLVLIFFHINFISISCDC